MHGERGRCNCVKVHAAASRPHQRHTGGWGKGEDVLKRRQHGELQAGLGRCVWQSSQGSPVILVPATQR
eukprot:10578865-Alexandrium_andersonii.AAC.1